jgi:L-threonylcarbamoyladenylate synthase
MLPLSGPRPCDLAAVATAVRQGGVIGIPTDTVYGLAADPMSEKGMTLLFTLKGRPLVKPIAVLAASLEQAQRVGVIEGKALEAAQQYWPGALTVVVPRAPGLPHWVGDSARDTVGVRVPDHPTALTVLAATGPLAVTSANRADEAPAIDDAGAKVLFPTKVTGFIPGTGAGTAPSTVVDFTGPAPKVLRTGPVPWEEG